MQNNHPHPLKAEARGLSFFYGGQVKALKGINMPIYEHQVTALIGPSGCGKSTFLRCFNRMHDLYPGNRYDGEIAFYPDNTNLLADDVDPIEVRMRIGMVFQKPNPFPKSIFENVAYGPVSYTHLDVYKRQLRYPGFIGSSLGGGDPDGYCHCHLPF